MEVSSMEPHTHDVLTQTEALETRPTEMEIVERTQKEFVKILQKSRIKLNKVASWAVKQKRRDVLKVLLEQNVDIDSINSSWSRSHGGR
jgi:hypothetical protein